MRNDAEGDMMGMGTGRREFLRRSVLAAGAAIASAPGVAPGQEPAPSSATAQVPSARRLNIAGIGVGHQGGNDLKKMAETENIVALCDVDHGFAAPVFKQYPNAKVYKDYREMLDKEKGIEAVVIGTPDHSHAVIAAAAMRAGKHVFCEKPLAHDVRECRRLAEIARETKVVTQMGIQGHSGEGIRLVREWIEAGLIGAVREIDAWCSLSYYPGGQAYWSPKQFTRPADTPPVPPQLDWDLWIGPAPMRPYHSVYHPGAWRAWWDFGVGMMGDRGAHTLDAAVWALQLGKPESIEANTMGNNPESHPLAAIVTYRFAARGALPPVKLTWYEGLRPPRPTELEDGRQLGHPEGGLLFKGSKALLVAGVYAESPRIIPEARMKELTPALPPKTLPRVPEGHYMNFVRACKGETQAVAPFEYAAHLSEICLLGNVAKRFGARIAWDDAAMRVTNLPEANEWIQRPYREGWSL